MYQFFAGKSLSGWCIVIFTVGVQFWLLSFFVKGSEIDLSDDKVDVVYTWKCPRDYEECFSTKALDAPGWIGFAVLVGAHVLADVINSGRMIVLSAKERHSFYFRARFFIGGTTLCSVSLFTFFVSTLMISSTTSSLSPTSTCRIADKSTCGCDNAQKSDYRGTINTTNEGAVCAQWDADWMSFDGEAYQENYCRNPLNDVEGPGCYTSVNLFGNDGLPKFSRCNIPACDPCSCTLTCEQPNLSKMQLPQCFAS